MQVLRLARTLPALQIQTAVQPVTRGILRLTLRVSVDFLWQACSGVSPFLASVFYLCVCSSFIVLSFVFILKLSNVLKAETFLCLIKIEAFCQVSFFFRP